MDVDVRVRAHSCSRAHARTWSADVVPLVWSPCSLSAPPYCIKIKGGVVCVLSLRSEENVATNLLTYSLVCVVGDLALPPQEARFFVCGINALLGR